jgi:response regulator RpfG family c-di-GMP phosphodiesterase
LKRPKLAIFCTDFQTIRTLTTSVSSLIELLWSRDPRGLKDIAADSTDLAAVLVDIAAAQDDAIQVFQSIKSLRPQVRRILLTDYCDLSIIVRGLHTEAVQTIVYKPVYVPELLAAVGVQNHSALHAAAMQAHPASSNRAAI